MILTTLLVSLAPTAVALPQDAAPIRLPRDPRISPDGDTIAFAWSGDVWTAPVTGGGATRLTTHGAEDERPRWSPDGETLYFQSNRSGRPQIWAAQVDRSAAPRQVTFDSVAKRLLHVTADGESLVVRRRSDRGWHYSERERLMLVDPDGESAPRMLFDAGAMDGAVAPDGKSVAFCRGRSAWFRKGYEGPQASQLWRCVFDGGDVILERLDADRERYQNVAAMDPMWADGGRSLWYTSDPEGVFDLFRMEMESGEVERMTNVGADGSDDGVAFPSMSADGRTVLFRRGFDLSVLDVRTGEVAGIELHAASDSAAQAIENVQTERAVEVCFTPDGKQMAFVAGNDVWTMDRVLKEPRRVTDNAHVEGSLAFSADGQRLFYTSDAAGEVDVWIARLAEDANGIWWLPESDIELERITDDPEVESGLALSPKGEHVAYLRGSDVFVMDDDGSDARRVVQTWSGASFDWSPDGRWLTFATQDDDYNSEIFVVPLDGTREPFNLSRHPDNDYGPRWSTDGKRIAWVGRRDGEEADIHWIDLTNEAAEGTERDERLEEALKKMEPKGGKKNALSENGEGDADEVQEGDAKEEETAPEKDEDLVHIDFDGIHDRLRRFRNSDSFEGSLAWFDDDGSRLAFSGSVDGKGGFYSIGFPRPEDPKRIADSGLSAARWHADAKEFTGHSRGVPASQSKGGKTETYKFRAFTSLDWGVVRQAAFDQAWRAMRDDFYDPAFNNKDWERIRAKYRPVAAQCLGAKEFSELCNMMLGELNASHMGHYTGNDPLPDHRATNDWTPRTMYLGLRFADGAEGPGLLVESVIPGSPAARERSRVEAGERVLSIDGTPVDPAVDIDRLLTMPQERDVLLRVSNDAGEERDVTIRPAGSVAGLLYPEWVDATREKVEELSNGKLGYLHIQGMNFRSFRQMEEDLYAAGYGKDGLIIDVRYNGGGSTTDHVLTALTQPVHAVTRSRGSGEGYPQDRKIYASWSKPIVLMCNEHSFSNAEILSHAIKQLGRGTLVGMRTAGGVISTGSVGLVDGSLIRMPRRGWYLATTGEDMELNGCEPDVALWNGPDWASPGGEDVQLARAVESLQAAVEAAAETPSPRLVPAAELRR
ncbi:MAG: S41 family peptidase [Planctomycetota bacterium]